MKSAHRRAACIGGRCHAAVAVTLFLACGDSGVGSAAKDGAAETIARVSVATLSRRSIVERLPLYGVVVPGPGGTFTGAVAFESQVRRLHVRVGQRVKTGDVLLEVSPSPTVRLSFNRAQADSEAASEELRAVQERLNARLATRTELVVAKRNARESGLRMQSLARRGASSSRRILAPGPAVVTRLHVANGTRAGRGAPLVNLELSDHREVHLGVEAAMLDRIHVGQTIRVSDLGLPRRTVVDAVVREVGESVDDRTQLVDVYAAIDDDAELLLGQRVVVIVAVNSGPTLVVPRSSLVAQPERLVIFTVDENEHAHAHKVRPGVENDVDVAVTGNELVQGARVVTSGAAVLTEGMLVRPANP